ncbi:Peptidoglycan D,D-transpeptidase MrdA [Bacillus safensis subsp. safensis]
MAQYVSTIANGGYRLRPQLVKEVRESDPQRGIGAVTESVKPDVLNKLDMTSDEIKRVQQGFKLVMQNPRGTAYSNFGNKKYNPAGKTGTAQSFYDGTIRSRRGTSTYNTKLLLRMRQLIIQKWLFPLSCHGCIKTTTSAIQLQMILVDRIR